MNKVLMTGSGGVIGTVLTSSLPFEITGYDLPANDVNDFNQLMETARGHDTLIHLAWNKHGDDWLAENLNPENIQTCFNVFEAAHQAGVKRVIIASSVHADDFVGDHISGLLDPYALPTPDSPYGASKCMLESLGRYYAHAKRLEVICIRFGGINKYDTPPEHPYSERQVWLSHNDCSNLINACVQASEVPDRYAIVYAVSKNKHLTHDLQNPFNWEPEDSAD